MNLLETTSAARLATFVMTVQTFRDLLSAQPFQPFRLVMSSGEKYEVKHPEMVMLLRSDIVVGFEETRDGLPTRFKVYSYLQVMGMEPIAAQNVA